MMPHSRSSDMPLPRDPRTLLGWTVSSMLWLILSGCSSADPDPADAGPELPGPTEILQQMVDAYREASSYSDQALVRLRYRHDGQWIEDEASLKVVVRRPNQARIQAYRATVVSNGTRLFARIDDRATRSLDGQVLVRKTPETLTLQDLYRDPVLQNALTSGLGRQPIQLELLLAEQPIETVFAPQAKRRRLTPKTLQGRPCHRVEARTAEGAFVFWIDQQSSTLRRLEYPVETLAAREAARPQVRDLELIAEFCDARLGQPVADESFTFRMTADAKRVRELVVPPPPLPSPLLGERPASFTFSAPGGEELSRESLSGKIAVLVWFKDHPACRSTLKQLDEVSAAYDRRRQVQFAAVCAEPLDVSDEALLQLLDDWDVELPMVRDRKAHGRDVFQIPGAPTLVVLDADGVVQIFEVGVNPGLAGELPSLLDRLLAGEDLAADVTSSFSQQQERYRRLLAAAMDERDATAADASRSGVPPERPPQTLRIARQWTTKEIERPGNIVPLSAERPLQLLVVENGRSIVQVDDAGRVVESHPLDLPPAHVGYLRTSLNRKGRRLFAISSVQAQQVHVFDEQWRRKFSYPPRERPHAGIADVRLGELNGDGRLDLFVGFLDEQGTHCLSLDGRRRWSNQATPSVLSLAMTNSGSGRRNLLVTGPRGDVLPIGADGKNAPPREASAGAVFHLFSDDFSAAASPAYCALTYDEAGNLAALGLDEQLNPQWSYPLPGGTYHQPIQFVTSATFLDDHYWIIAGPDGTVHLIRRDGKFSDHFACGQRLTGIAACSRADEAWLFTATESGLTAWSLQRN